ncbi:MAG: HigA family addiction module antidote protein [Deltaproteobacteria bacterium]|nr:HigA family addiction module antidote protein [Deltaproteobacteria bacterium]
MRIRKRPPTHPGSILKSHYLEPLSITLTDLAKILGVSRKTVSKIVNGHTSISSDMALRLSRAFDTSPELWLNMQNNYDLWHAVHDSKEWERVQPIGIPGRGSRAGTKGSWTQSV